MPFRKPQPPTFRVVTVGSREHGESLYKFFRSAMSCPQRSDVEEACREMFTVETKVPHMGSIRLEFIHAMLEDFQKLPASIYFHHVHFLVTIQDLAELHPVNMELNRMPGKSIRLFGIKPGERVGEDIIKDVMEERRGTCLKCDIITDDVIKRVIQIISNFLVIHRSGELESFRDEMSAVNLLHDKTTLTNSTMCYERNSIG